jgi:D-psicose/D-tagatose/L-ribulose 3-epimerase
MKFGVNLLLLGDSVTAAVRERFQTIRELGFDGVEVPVFAPATLEVDEIRSAAEKAGLGLTTSGALPPGAAFYSSDARARKRAVDYVRDSIRVVRELGAPLICGPLYKAVGDLDESVPLDKQRSDTAAAMRDLCAEAEANDVRLAFECLNRFETNLLNTTAQGIEFCRAAASPAAVLLLDTFHMHIEEKDSSAAITAAARTGVFGHFHASENDRGVAGTGQVHWTRVADAVRDAAYEDWCILESFNQDNQAIKTAVSCWRPFFASEDEFMRKGLAFVRELL